MDEFVPSEAEFIEVKILVRDIAGETFERHLTGAIKPDQLFYSEETILEEDKDPHHVVTFAIKNLSTKKTSPSLGAGTKNLAAEISKFAKMAQELGVPEKQEWQGEPWSAEAPPKKSPPKKTYPSMMANYNSTCLVCGKTIQQGAKIGLLPGTKVWAHINCVEMELADG